MRNPLKTKPVALTRERDRAAEWRAYQQLLASVDPATTSATGWQFLRDGAPPHPVRVLRSEGMRTTLVTWSDGVTEAIDDLVIK